MLYTPMHAYCQMSDDEIEMLSLQRASEEQVAEFEEHLLICEFCRDRVTAVEIFARPIRSGAAELRSRAAEKRSWWTIGRLIPVFSALALLLIAALTLPNWLASSAPPLAVTLTATRGLAPGSVVPAGRALAITPDLTGLSAPRPYRLEVVDDTGQVKWQGSWDPSSGPAILPSLRAGTYFARIYSVGGELLREYGLSVKP
jgi:hypothetical protein